MSSTVSTRWYKSDEIQTESAGLLEAVQSINIKSDWVSLAGSNPNIDSLHSMDYSRSNIDRVSNNTDFGRGRHSYIGMKTYA